MSERGPEIRFPEPPWLTAKIDRRLAEIRARGAFEVAAETQPIIMTFLDEGHPDMTDEDRQRWERTCDNCGRYCEPHGEMTFYTGHALRVVDGRQVLMAYGVCDECKLLSEKTMKGNT
jgi:hypothetical protein